MFERRGFTLIEMMIVVLIVGILATVSIPRYIITVERGRSAEARQALGTIREAETAFYLENDQFTATIGDLGLPYPAACSASYHYRYAIAVSGAAFTATATRCTAGGKPPQGSSAHVVNLTQSGVLGGTAGIV
jgi:prepilin-type N-terminal cleavage/methylation domain-containing protein